MVNTYIIEIPQCLPRKQKRTKCLVRNIVFDQA